MSRWLDTMSVLGGITAVPLMIAFMMTGFGEPGTAAYQTYELLNRLMAISLPLDAVAFFTVSPFLVPSLLAVVTGYLLYAASTALGLSPESSAL